MIYESQQFSQSLHIGAWSLGLVKPVEEGRSMAG